ncbi:MULTISPECIES: glutamyl-tRNA reductase [unclassified Haematospirillum]|uniref:glutamyl-tRNA reductase n=1 Tax=unclassified Haematospirillum TaxID=2622088 RepID=UPI00143CB07D|nr:MULTISPECIES: glutamyl-tRNA reductase [unclassified Haematospirillum]NKD54704.1 glutamyl-tRNA reductase [Haematospirillum sp. H4890]NKD74542.1 glutamyl-tRNA reductase [Haematospirillum sp. H4485]
MVGRAADLLCIVGVNHRSGTLALRDALVFEDQDIPAALHALKASGIGQAVLLSTCDRVEVIAVGSDPSALCMAVMAFLAGHAGQSVEEIREQGYVRHGKEAVQHLFAVASSLDSMVIGEPHVLGQLKAAHRLSREQGMTGSALESCLQAAYATAKRVRQETGIARHPVSLTASALQVARDLFGDLRSRSLLVIGGVDLGDMMADAFQEAGVSAIMASARRPSLAERLAARLNGHVLPFEAIATVLVNADIVIASVGARTWSVTADMVAMSLRMRRQKPVLLLDLGVPGDIEAAVGRMPNAFLYDMQDLEHVAEEGRSLRENEARAAWSLVSAEVASFFRCHAERDAVPVIAALHQKFEAERLRALHEAGDDASKATRLLIGRLLHDPSETLRSMAGRPDSAEDYRWAERVLRRLFVLENKD